MQEIFKPTEIKQREGLPVSRRNVIQVALIDYACKKRGLAKSPQRDAFISELIARWADNFDQLDSDLVRSYEAETDQGKRADILGKMLAALEDLNAING